MLSEKQSYLFLTLFLTVVTLDTFAQGAYTSRNNSTGNWETASIWTKQHSWMADAPPGPANVGGSYTINLYGYVIRNGNLTISGGATFNIYDTLVIDGNLTVSSSSGIYVRNGGILVVLGNFSSSGGGNKITNENGGDVVITGNYNQAQGTTSTSSTFYVFDSSPSFNWGSSVNGTGYNGSNTNAMASNFKSEAQLFANDLPLYNFVNGFFTPLPVSLINFRGTAGTHGILLEWATVSETNSEKFVIERSSTGASEDFIAIGQVQSAGESKQLVQYSFTDPSPREGKNYYRLMAVDLDGSVEYFNVVVVEHYSGEFKVYPNPARAEESIYFTRPGAPDENDQIIVFSTQGNEITREIVSDAENQIAFKSSLSSGIYLVKYVSSGFTKTVRLVIE